MDLRWCKLRTLGLVFKYYHVGPMPYDDLASGGALIHFIVALEEASTIGFVTEIGERIDRNDESLLQENRRVRMGDCSMLQKFTSEPQFFEAWLAERPGGTLQRKVPRVEGTGKVAAELVDRLKAQVTGSA